MSCTGDLVIRELLTRYVPLSLNIWTMINKEWLNSYRATRFFGIQTIKMSSSNLYCHSRLVNNRSYLQPPFDTFTILPDNSSFYHHHQPHDEVRRRDWTDKFTRFFDPLSLVFYCSLKNGLVHLSLHEKYCTFVYF